MTAFNRAIFDIVAVSQPCTARQTYYRAVVAGLVEKDSAGSRKNEKMVGAALDTMRERAVQRGLHELDDWDLRYLWEHTVMPMIWLTDNTRTRYQADLHEDKDAALRDTARLYRRDLWRHQERHVEVWCESDSIGGVLLDVTDAYGVALLPCRGQSGKRFVWDSAQAYRVIGRPVTCLYIGDFDPSGLDIGRSVEERLARYGAAGVQFTRIAVTPGQVASGGLPGHGLNPNHPASVRRRFTEVCDEHGIPHEAVEAEAMPPAELRELVRDAIEEHIDPRQWETEQAVEAEERRMLSALATSGGER